VVYSCHYIVSRKMVFVVMIVVEVVCGKKDKGLRKSKKTLSSSEEGSKQPHMPGMRYSCELYGKLLLILVLSSVQTDCRAIGKA